MRLQWRRAIAENKKYLCKVFLLSVNRAGLGYIFHVSESIQIVNQNTIAIIENKNLTMVYILCRVFLVFKFFKYIFNIIFDGAHFAPVSPKSVTIANKYLTMVDQQILYCFLLFKVS